MTAPTETSVGIPLDNAMHAGDLYMPASGATGIVLFAHGSGSSRRSPRNRMVAGALHEKGLATLLFDLLTESEDRDYETRFDIELLTRRLVSATDWLGRQQRLRELAIGYFGASTGAAAALRAAAALPDRIHAVVSRGGRPDLAMADLPEVRAPTLLIVGGADWQVLELNRQAHARLNAVKSLEVVPNATHLFEEPGALEQVALLAGAWFRKYLGKTAAPS
ncbi:MAG TPA: alpha/beta hydrolase [Gammaproteobacteria bacterium]|nr:alpha/beta hydrolase [Gammaproteobacteria bacterium]